MESDPLTPAAKQLESPQTNTLEDYMRLENKVALISGGARGMGEVEAYLGIKLKCMYVQANMTHGGHFFVSPERMRNILQH